MFVTEEPYLAAVRGGQVGWWQMASGKPEVMAEVSFTIRAAQSTGAQRDISLCFNTVGLLELQKKVDAAVLLAQRAEENPLVEHPDNKTT